MKKIILKSIPPILYGSLLTLAFAPFRIDIIAILSLVLFFYTLNKCTKAREAFFISALFGIGFFGTSISWVYISIHLFTESVTAGLSAAIALVILLSFLHTIPFGTFSYILTKKSNNITKILIYPALWTLFEIVKANLLWGGFPWVSIGYSQTESPLVWFANIGGVYFVTYIVAFIACLITFYIIPVFNKTSKSDSKLKTKALLALIAIFAFYAISYTIEEKQPDFRTNQIQKVVLVQGDFIQGFKWNQNNFIKMQHYYKDIVEKYRNSLIILSENAITAYRQYMKDYFDQLRAIANKNNNAMLIGSLSIEQNKVSSKVYNSSIIIGKGQGVYNKHHLVPFGEYFPIKFFGYVDSAGLSSFNAGKYVQPLMSAFNHPLANFMCYETAYPEQIRDQSQNAGFISIISDDSWFGDSIARYQQLQISQVRAIENAKYILSTTSNGITAIIQPNGKIAKQIPKDIRGTLTDSISINHLETIWTKLGMSLIWLIIVITFIIGLFTKEFLKER